MPSPKRHDVSPQRKLVFYAGMALIAVGGIMFLSTFFDGPKVGMPHGAFGEKMEETAQRAVIGMIVLGLGVVLMGGSLGR